MLWFSQLFDYVAPNYNSSADQRETFLCSLRPVLSKCKLWDKILFMYLILIYMVMVDFSFHNNNISLYIEKKSNSIP
jgi:hypothetical protein